MIIVTSINIDGTHSTIHIDPNDIIGINRADGIHTGHTIIITNQMNFLVTDDLLTICTLVAIDRADRPDDKEEGCTDLVAGPFVAISSRVTIHPDGTIVIDR